VRNASLRSVPFVSSRNYPLPKKPGIKPPRGIRIFTWVLERLAQGGLIKGKPMGVDSTTLEANAAMKSTVRRDTGESYRLAHAKVLLTDVHKNATMQVCCPAESHDRAGMLQQLFRPGFSACHFLAMNRVGLAFPATLSHTHRVEELLASR